VPLLAIALVLTSSIFHVAWNTLVKTSGDPLATSTRAVGLGVLAVTPVALLAWLASGRPSLTPEGWLIALASGIVSAAYFVPLSAAYRRGALSSVYPVARGTGALLGVLVGIVVLGERLQPPGYLGIVLLLGGTLTAALATASRATILPALLAGCAVAGYSALDRVGVRTGPAWLYAWALWAVCAVMLVAWRALTARTWATSPSPHPAGAATVATGSPVPATVATSIPTGALVPASAAVAIGDPPAVTPDPAGDPGANGTGPAGLRRSLAAGLLMIGTYMLVLLAFQIAPLAGVAPLRESATILAAAWGVVALGERDRAGVRLAAAGAVAVGAILLAVGG
jgi:drug/metabolite transporter (DMT)-like permease